MVQFINSELCAISTIRRQLERQTLTAIVPGHLSRIIDYRLSVMKVNDLTSTKQSISIAARHDQRLHSRYDPPEQTNLLKDSCSKGTKTFHTVYYNYMATDFSDDCVPAIPQNRSTLIDRNTIGITFLFLRVLA
ncbi:hypothetical protein TNCV_1115961 [Trichonephila clavipes]|nr:hypothetical protein TNCV_1115961 [Trichonephila clavipes]